MTGEPLFTAQVIVILPSGLSLAASGDCPVAEGALKITLNANAVVPSLPVGPEPLREIGKLYLCLRAEP
jgi:hypothetical protein